MRMSTLFTAVAAALFIGRATAAATGPTASSSGEELAKELAPKLEKILGPNAVERVLPSSYAGLYEVLTPRGIVYTDSTGSFVNFGPIIDSATKVNLSDKRFQEFGKFNFNELPFKDAIKSVKGDGSRVIATFEDPNCGFCRKLINEIEKLDNVTVYTFLIPILGADSAVKATAIWCAQDQSAAWIGFMTGKARLTTTAGFQCETPFQRNMALQAKLRITGTPAILFQDNTKKPGYVTADVIEAKLKIK